jgi:hypothetical protein
MRKLGTIVLGLALIAGALAFAGYRYLEAQKPRTPQVAARGVAPTASPTARSLPGTSAPGPAAEAARKAEREGLSGLQMFELGLNAANVLVGILGIWMTMRGIRAERRAEAAGLRRER